MKFPKRAKLTIGKHTRLYILVNPGFVEIQQRDLKSSRLRGVLILPRDEAEKLLQYLAPKIQKMPHSVDPTAQLELDQQLSERAHADARAARRSPRVRRRARSRD